MPELRSYEVMMIVEPGTSAEDIVKMHDSVEQIVTKQGASIVKYEDMGQRRLAYEINHRKEGHYLLFEIEGSGKEIAELERRLRVSDAILRYLTVRVDLDRKAAAKIVAKRDKRRARRASFRNSNAQSLDVEDFAKAAGEVEETEE